jgi:hypothetical protein
MEQSEVELFNHHQSDVRARFNFLVQAVFLLAGGALTASITVFTGSRSVALTAIQGGILGCSWWALVASICLSLVAVAAVLLRDYSFGERWRKSMNGDLSVDVSGTPGWPDVVIISSGLLSLLCFLCGFVGIAYVATQIVERLSK